jgi:ABC-2 type transport system ATP-binding protein
MRRRLDIAASLVVIPDLLFLDEPTTGLDPRSRNQVWEVVRSIVDAGTTVLLTTQYLDEADQLADRVAVMDRGRTIAEGTTDELKSAIGAGGLRVRVADAARRPEAERVLAERLGVAVRAERDPATLGARLEGDAGDRGERAAAALADLTRAGIAVSDFAVGQPSLDEVFLSLTGVRPGEGQ